MNTEKEETLNEIIAWCEQRKKAEQDATAVNNSKGHFDTGTWYHGRMTAFHEIAQYCESMLRFSGSMPLEVENQSEDAK